MIGIVLRTTSPSSVVSRRRTPWVAGWCGPMLIVKSSSWVSGSISVPETGRSGSSRRAIVTDASRSRYGTLSGSGVPWSLIPAWELVFVVGEDHGLAADREVAALRVTLVVLGHEDAAQVGVPVEADAEHVEDLALLVVGGREEVNDRRHHRVVRAHARAHAKAFDAVHREQLVVHAQARLVGQVVDPVHRHQPLVRLVGVLAQVDEHVAHARRRDLERRLVAVIGRAD